MDGINEESLRRDAADASLKGIAELITAVPVLLDEITRLRTEITRLRNVTHHTLNRGGYVCSWCGPVSGDPETHHRTKHGPRGGYWEVR